MALAIPFFIHINMHEGRKYFKVGDLVNVKRLDIYNAVILKKTDNSKFILSYSNSQEFLLEDLSLSTFDTIYHLNLSNGRTKELLRDFRVNRVQLKLMNKIEKIISSCFNSENLDIIRVGRQAITVVLYFPTIIIKNSSDFEHKINDFYVKFNIDISSDYYGKNPYLQINNLQGLKATFTPTEIKHDYNHSHVDWKGETQRYSSFCMGQGRFTDLYHYFGTSRVDNEDNILNLEEFLLGIEPFISWESIEGGPYCHIHKLNKYEVINADIHKSVRGSNFDRIKNELFRDIDDNKAETDIVFVNNDAFVVVSLSKIHSLAESLLPKTVYHKDGVCYKKSMSFNEAFDKVTDIERNFFKGNRIELKIIEQESDFNFKTEDLAVHPGEVKYVYNLINKNFIKFQILNYEPTRAEIQDQAKITY